MTKNSKHSHPKFPIWFDARAADKDAKRWVIETDIQGYRLIYALLEHYGWQMAKKSGLEVLKNVNNRFDD